MASRAEPTRSALAVAASSGVAAIALRGYVPDAPRPTRTRPPDSALSTVLVIGSLVAAVVIVAVAVVIGARHRTAGRAVVAARPDWLRGDLAKPSWRTWLVAVAVLAAAVCAAILLSGLGGGIAPESSAPVPSGAGPDGSGSVSTDMPSPPPEPPHHDLVGYLAGATGLFLAVLVVGSVVAGRRQRQPVPGAGTEGGRSEPEDGAHTLARAAEVGLVQVEDHGRDPRAAIIACYVAMERELARVPEAMPEDCDTAAEVLARAVENRVLGPDSATRLVDLFDEARFSPHVMSEAHRDVAADVLARVLDELRVST